MLNSRLHELLTRSVGINMENIGIAVRGRDGVLGSDPTRPSLSTVTTPASSCCRRPALPGWLETFEYLDDLAIKTEPSLANEVEMHRDAPFMEDIDASHEVALKHGI